MLFIIMFIIVVNTLRPRQNGRHFADDILKCIFLNENVWIPIKISLKFVPQCPINNIPALVQIMVWRRPGDKPLSGPMMVRLPTHICVTRPQWVKWHMVSADYCHLQLLWNLTAWDVSNIIESSEIVYVYVIKWLCVLYWPDILFLCWIGNGS